MNFRIFVSYGLVDYFPYMAETGIPQDVEEVAAWFRGRLNRRTGGVRMMASGWFQRSGDHVRVSKIARRGNQGGGLRCSQFSIGTTDARQLLEEAVNS